MKKILFLDDFDFIKHNIGEVKKISSDKNTAIIPLSDAVFFLLKKEGINCENYHAYECEGIYDDAYTTAKNWAKDWYKPFGQDFTEVNSISLGSLVEWAMTSFFSHVLRLHCLFKAIITKNDPSEISIISCSNFNYLDITKDLYKLGINSYVDVLQDCLKKTGRDERVKKIVCPYPAKRNLKRVEVIRPIFILGNFLAARIFDILGGIYKKDKKILFFEGFHHLYNVMKAPYLKEYQIIHLQKKFGISKWHRIYKNGIKIVLLPKNKARHKSYKFQKDDIKEKLLNSFKFKKDNIFSCVWGRLEFLLNDFFPNNTCPKVENFTRIIKIISPNCVVTENDVTYYEKMLVSVSRANKIPTVVVQHGISACGKALDEKKLVEYSFYPLTADYLFTYGQAFEEWFKKKGIDGERIIKTGGSRFDDYYKNRGFVEQNTGRKKVLIVLQDLWDEASSIIGNVELNVLYRHIFKFIETAKQLSEVDFIVRPRDKNNLWQVIFKKDLSCVNNIKISMKESPNVLLKEVDLVIGYFSTLLVEALIHGKPVISLNTSDYYNCLPLWEYNLSKQLNSVEGLKEQVEHILYNRKEREDIEIALRKNLYLFNFGNDGMATKRIAEKLKIITT